MTVGDFTRAARLILSLARHEIEVQRKDSFLGLVWVVLWPAVQAGGFLLAFNLLRGGGYDPDSVLTVYIGVLIWTTASSVLISNLSILKRKREMIMHIVFPFSILCVVDLTVKFVMFLAQACVAVVVWLLISPSSHWMLVVAYLPIYLLAFYLALMAMAWVASVFGVVLPDLSYFLPPVLMLCLALSPIFQRDAEALPWAVRLFNEINPFSLWVTELYATIDVGKTGPSAPILFLAVSIAAVVAARLFVHVFYRHVAKVI